MILKKTYRIDEKINLQLQELKRIYNEKSENELIKKIIEDIYEVKKTKALVPFEEVDKRDKELQKVIFELGRLKGTIEEKEKNIKELKEKISESQKEKKSFWTKLFGRD
ncbi:hypothetical protein [Desulfonauticus submarinus]